MVAAFVESNMPVAILLVMCHYIPGSKDRICEYKDFSDSAACVEAANKWTQDFQKRWPAQVYALCDEPLSSERPRVIIGSPMPPDP